MVEIRRNYFVPVNLRNPRHIENNISISRAVLVPVIHVLSIELFNSVTFILSGMIHIIRIKAVLDSTTDSWHRS